MTMSVEHQSTCLIKIHKMYMKSEVRQFSELYLKICSLVSYLNVGVAGIGQVLFERELYKLLELIFAEKEKSRRTTFVMFRNYATTIAEILMLQCPQILQGIVRIIENQPFNNATSIARNYNISRQTISRIQKSNGIFHLIRFLKQKLQKIC